MADIVRHAAPADVPGMIALANKVFRCERSGDMGGEFPLLFHPNNAENMCVGERGGRVVSLVGVMRFVMQIDGANIPVASIGSVCTEPSMQGQGLASRLMDMAIADARGRGDVLMPISGRRTLYYRNNAFLFGPYHHLTVPRRSLGGAIGRPFEPGDGDSVLALHEAEPVRYRWNRPVFDRLVEAKFKFGSESWVHRAASGRVDGWALLLVGSSYGPAQGEARLVDWVGPPEIVAGLCASALERSGNSRLTMSIPWHRQSLLKLMAPVAEQAEVTLQRIGTLRLLNLPRLVALLAGRLAPLKPRATETSLRLGDRRRAVTLDDPAAIHHLLFTRPEHWPEDVSEKLPRELGEAVAGPLPIPIPEYGICYT